MCSKKFPSRNQLFKHLRSAQHGRLTKQLSPFLRACQEQDWDTALSIWGSSHGFGVDVHACTDAGRTALHMVAEAADATPARLELARCLVAAGASVTVMSRPDTIWGIPEMEGTPVTPLQLARQQQRSSLARVLLGYSAQGAAPDCDCCGDEFILCCELLEPPLACGHRCCPDTLVGWCVAQAQDGATLDSIGCPVCLTALGPAQVAKYLKLGSQRDLLAAIEQRTLEMTLVSIPGFVWCPRCSSGGIAHCQNPTCADCGYEFCLKCKHNWQAHHGLSCHELAGNEAAQSLTWLEDNTRGCPKCHVAIVHSGGCSHMTCRMCQHNFCWLCMGDFKDRLTMNPELQLERAQKSTKQVKCPCGNLVKATLFNRSR